MFAKTCCVIVAVGAFGCALLAMRQARLQAASELTQTQLRISKLDRNLWDLRAKIAEQTTPTAIETMAAGLGPLRPMVPDTGALDPAELAEMPAQTPVPPQPIRHAGR